MNQDFGVKKAFTLVEMIIVIILVGSLYFLLFSSFSTKEEKKVLINIENIKTFLLKNFEYEKEMSFSCIEDEKLSCYLFLDKERKEEISFPGFFKEIPIVYNYDRELNEASFNSLRIDNIEYNIFFQLKFDEDKKHKSLILDTNDDEVYLINSITKDIKKFESTNEIIDTFYNKEIEVKDAL